MISSRIPGDMLTGCPKGAGAVGAFATDITQREIIKKLIHLQEALVAGSLIQPLVRQGGDRAYPDTVITLCAMGMV